MHKYIFTWDLDPEFISLFGFHSLRYYTLFFATGLIIGGRLVKGFITKAYDSSFQIDLLFIYIVIGIIVGARLGHCLFYDPIFYFHNPIEMLMPIQKINNVWEFTGYLGLASHGGALGVLSGVWLFCRHTGYSFLGTTDALAVAVPLTGAFIRVGNFMNSEIVGIPTGGNYGIIFKSTDMIPRHPSQLYEALVYLIIFLFIFYNHQKLVKIRGRLTGIMIVLVFSSRFILEYFKSDQAYFEKELIFSLGQLLSVPFVIFGAYLLIRTYLYPHEVNMS